MLIGTLNAAEPVWCVVAIMASAAFNGAVYATSTQLPQDLSPNYAGSLAALAAVVTTTSGFLAPMLVAWQTQAANTMAEWSRLFGYSGALFVVSGAVFMCFGSVRVQAWNEVKQTSKSTTTVDLELAAKS